MTTTAASATISYDDIDGKNIVDLGTGTGMLGLGCALMGAASVLGIDADMDALEIAMSNRENLDMEDTVDFMLCDVSSMPMRRLRGDEERRSVDTVVMNPPFGTRNKVRVSISPLCT